jgi:hypothetical protein
MILFCLNRIFPVSHIDGIGSLPRLHFQHLLWQIYLYDLGPFCQKFFLGEYPDEGRLSLTSKRSESLRPNRHSGVPERYARIIICPETSARNEVPVADIKKFTFSITSTNASLRRYLMSLRR